MTNPQANVNMIKQQIRTMDVTDEAVLAALSAIAREQFVPLSYQSLAYADTTIPLGHDQVMLAPSVQARILQMLAIGPNDKILEIGTGSGYLTALLAKLGKHVHSVEIFPELTQMAKEHLAPFHFDNICLLTEDAWQHVDALRVYGPFDVIVSTCALYEIPQNFFNFLNEGGRLLGIFGKAPSMEVTLTTKLPNGKIDVHVGFETVAPYAVNIEASASFQF